jgi:hypothetical protein
MTPVTTMAQSTLVLRDSKPIDDRVTLSITEVTGVTVTDPRSYALAGEHLQGLAALSKEIVAYFKDDKARAYALWKSQCKKESDALCRIDDAAARLRAERQTWKAAQDRLQRDAEQRAALAAQQQQQARLLAEAALLEQQHQPELAAAVVEEAISAPAPVVVLPSFVPKDLPKRTLYKWRVVNEALVPREFLTLNEKRLTGYATSMKGAARVPGVQFYTEEIDIVRA